MVDKYWQYRSNNLGKENGEKAYIQKSAFTNRNSY